MNMSSSLDGLRSLLGISSTQPTATPHRNSASTAPSSAVSSDLATVSNAGSEVSQALSSDGVRLDKVASIQAALAAGTYSVPASAVASRVMDAMLAGGH